jgi:hypothetical protein
VLAAAVTEVIEPDKTVLDIAVVKIAEVLNVVLAVCVDCWPAIEVFVG